MSITHFFSRTVLFFCIGILVPQISLFAQQIEGRSTATGLRIVRYNSDGSPQLLLPTQQKNIHAADQQSISIESGSKEVHSLMQSILNEYFPQLVTASLEQTGFNHVGNLIISTYQIYYSGIPVRERVIKMNTGAQSGQVVSILSTLPSAQPNATSAEVPELVATRIAFSDFSKDEDVKLTQAPKLVYCVADEVSLRLAYELIISEGNSHVWRYTIDAENSSVIEKTDLTTCHIHSSEAVSDTPAADNVSDMPSANILPPTVQHEAPQYPQAEESGKLFAMILPTAPTDTEILMPLPTTFITINGTQVNCDTLGNWTALNASYPLQITGSLSSPYQSLKSNQLGELAKLNYTVEVGASKDIIWNNFNSDASERNAYYHTILARNHVLSVDKTLTTLSSKKVFINVNIDDQCNAFYNPQENSLNYFRAKGGCANTALIPDVVYHEFGHRVNHMRYLKAGKGYMVDGNLNEGYADVMSCLFRDSSVIGIGFFGKNKILRNINNTAKWPTSINTFDTHINGLMPAGAIWDLRKKIGRDKTLALFHQSGYQTPDGTGSFKPGKLLEVFWKSLESILISDDDNNNLLDGTPNAGAIIESFAMHNIGAPQFIDIRPVVTPDQNRWADAYYMQTKVTYNSIAATIDKSSVKVHYSTDNGKTYSAVTLADIGNDNFGGTIPKAAIGTIVKYYFSAGVNYPEVSRVSYPPASEPLTFLVDVPSMEKHSCESPAGWEMSNPNTDIAESGNWDNVVPFGTYTSEATPYIQQDSDHTTDGTRCFVTGNSSSRLPNSNTIDTGNVTLTSPAFDLSSYKDPIIRYWYYFRNDEREISSSPLWTVKISNNGTTFTKNIQNTSTITKGWTPVTFHVKDMISPTSTVHLRFIANNKLRVVVEAGLDDIEIFEMPTNAVEPETHSSITLGKLFPNPILDEMQLTIPFSLEKAQPYVIRIVNAQGQEIITTEQSTGIAGENIRSIKLPKLTPSGSYILELSTPSSMQHQKFMITK